MQLSIPLDCFSYTLMTTHGTKSSKSLTSCTVNAGVVRWYLRQSQSNDESRFGRSDEKTNGLYPVLIQQQGVRNLVLGSFGTYILRNRMELAAEVWKHLLISESAHPFDRVVLCSFNFFRSFGNRHRRDS